MVIIIFTATVSLAAGFVVGRLTRPRPPRA